MRGRSSLKYVIQRQCAFRWRYFDFWPAAGEVSSILSPDPSLAAKSGLNRFWRRSAHWSLRALSDALTLRALNQARPPFDENASHWLLWHRHAHYSSRTVKHGRWPRLVIGWQHPHHFYFGTSPGCARGGAELYTYRVRLVYTTIKAACTFQHQYCVDSRPRSTAEASRRMCDWFSGQVHRSADVPETPCGELVPVATRP